MAEKKYYWMRLKPTFFTSKEIKKLRKIAGGDTYIIIYLKMQLLSLETGGKLYYDGIEDNFADEIALELDEDADNVRMTLAYLEKCGLIEQRTDDEYYLPEVSENTGSETAAAGRMRKSRNRNIVTVECNNVTPLLQDRYTEKEKEKELELDNREIKKKIKKEKVSGFDSIISEYTENENLRQTIVDFIGMRKAIKHQLTDRALKMTLAKLDSLSSTDEGKIKILEQSIFHSWQGVFPLKEEPEEQQTGDGIKWQ